MGANEEIYADAVAYFRIVSAGYLFHIFNCMVTAALRGVGITRLPMIYNLGSGALNVFLNRALIGGRFGFPALGVAGAAWATTISMGTSAILAISHFVSKRAFIRFRRHSWAPKFYIFRNILAIGISPFSMNVAGSAVAALLNNQLLHYGGDNAVAASGVANSFGPLVIMLVIGICQGMQPIAGYNYGAGRLDRLREVYKLAMISNVTIGIFGTLLVLFVPRYLAMAFTSDSELIDLCVPALRYMLVMSPLIGFTITNSQFFQSIDKPWIAIVTSLSRQVLILIPMIYIIPPIYEGFGWDGLMGVFASCTGSDILGAALAGYLLYTQRSILQKK